MRCCDRREFLMALGLGSITGEPSVASVHEAFESLRHDVHEVVVPYAPGGGADLAGRLVVDAFSSAGATRAVVLNRPGVAGTVGSKHVAQSSADGRTWLISGIGSHVIAPQWQATSYDPFNDFEHLAILGGTPSVLVVNTRKRVTRLQDLMGNVSWASPGTGSHGHLLGTLIMQQLGLRHAVHVPYKGGTSAMQDVLGGHVDLAVMTLSSFLPQARHPEVRALAVTSLHRVDGLADVPTFAEQGLRGLTATTWFSLSAPRGLPDVHARWASKALNRYIKTESVQARLRKMGVVSTVLEPDRAVVFMREEWERWGKVIASISGQ
jgi:tripartite-type tricarboxylate transporter receptor subunit TctC